MKRFKCRVITRNGIIFEDEITSLIAPGKAGYLGVLPSHAPFFSILKDGKLTLKNDSSISTLNLKRGIMNVMHNTATFLVEEA